MRRRAFLSAVPALAGCDAIWTITRRNITALGRYPRRVPHRFRDPRRTDVRLAVTWIGHATVLVQLGDRFFLTDPVFSDTVGQFSPRLVEPGLALDVLPELTAVVVSHAHFDHLDFRSLEAVAPLTDDLLVPRGTLVYVPPLRGVRAREVRPWYTVELGPTTRITAVPVRHQGYRYGVDTAWIEGGFTGWVFEHDGLTVYFGGDTAYDGDAFRRTRARFPRIDLALIPIAPVEPRELARANHLDGAEAVQAFFDLGADHMVPIHFDCFPQAADELGDATALLRQSMQKRGLDEQRIHILDVGQSWPPRAEEKKTRRR
ncbi:MAG: MBL fold metallo-hydrolase [Myxococcota bacterium]